MTPRTRRLFIMIITSMAALALGVGAIRPAPARAATAITFDGSPGTGPAPSTLGPYDMLAFGHDPQPLAMPVSGVTGPAGQVSFTPALLHLQVSDWASYQVQGSGWSNGYTGDVYSTGTLSDLQNARLGATSMTFTLPPGTHAFYFYAVPRIPATQDQPCPSPFFGITATAQDGTTSGPVSVSGCSARYFGFYTDGSANLTSITVVSPSIDFAVGEFGISSSAPQNYVALGESYSAGDGVPPYGVPPNGVPFPPYSYICDQSAAAWPTIVSHDLGFSGSHFSFRACTGARLNEQNGSTAPNGFPLGDLTGPQQVTNILGQIVGTWPAQEDTLIPLGTRLVTLDFGGNDVGFGPTLINCIVNWACPIFVGHTLDTNIAAIGPTLVQAYEEIARLAPNATIVVMGYPRWFPTDPPALCNDTTFIQPQMAWMNQEIQKLDTAIQTAVSTAYRAGVKHIRYVSGSYDAFTGHELCTASPYMNGLVPAPNLVASFHPNLGGNQQMARLAEQAAAATIIPVPNVVGLPATNALSAIRSAGLVPIEVSQVDTTCNHIGYVISQSPQAGGPIATGSPVTITVAVKPPNPCP